MSTAPVLSPALQKRLDSARQLTDSIFRLLKPEAFYSRPIPERHRLVFYLGHLEAFEGNLFRDTVGRNEPPARVPITAQPVNIASCNARPSASQ